VKIYFKSALVLASVFFHFVAAKADALEFSVYYCDYRSFSGSEKWVSMGRGWATYSAKLGWNETSPMSQALTQGTKGGELGVCSYVSSNIPKDVFINLFFVEGKNLAMLGDACMYSGEPVKFKGQRLQLTSNDEYLGSKKSAIINGVKLDFLHIAGVRPLPDGDPQKLCQSAFEAITKGQVVGAALDKHGLVNRRMKWPGFVYSED